MAAYISFPKIIGYAIVCDFRENNLSQSLWITLYQADDDDGGGGFRQHSDIFTWEVSNNPWVDKIMNSDKISELGQIYSGQA